MIYVKDASSSTQHQFGNQSTSTTTLMQQVKSLILYVQMIMILQGLSYTVMSASATWRCKLSVKQMNSLSRGFITPLGA